MIAEADALALSTFVAEQDSLSDDMRGLWAVWIVVTAIVIVGGFLASKSMIDDFMLYERTAAGGRRSAVRRSAIAWGLFAAVCFGPALWIVVSTVVRGVDLLENPVWAALGLIGIMVGLIAVGMVYRLIRLLGRHDLQ